MSHRTNTTIFATPNLIDPAPRLFPEGPIGRSPLFPEGPIGLDPWMPEGPIGISPVPTPTSRVL